MMTANPLDTTLLDAMKHGDDENSLKLSFYGVSSAGIREQNQDAFAVHHSESSMELTHKGVIACVADGVSCSQNGQQASQLCVTQFIEDYLSTPDGWGVKSSATRVLSSLNQWLYHHSQHSDLRHNGYISTFSAVIFKSNSLHLFHVGDSRVYRYRAGELTQLTRDHCHQRSGDKGFLTRALGMDEHLEVDYQCHEVKKGDSYLLTTDGVHDSLSMSELFEALVANVTLPDCGDALLGQAQLKGSDDNLTCLLLQVDGLPFADTDELAAQFADKVIPPVMQVGHYIDQFEVESVLYSGTRSHLYLVKQREDGERYVLKVPSLNYRDDANFLQSFIREQWVGQRTRHGALMRIYPNNSDFLYHLCQYIPGQTLRQWMYDTPNPDLAQMRVMVDGMVIAVRALQRLGVTHRDLKPENVMLTPDNRLVLIDYGAAQAEGLEELFSHRDEVPLGAAGYIAPEYLLSGKATHLSDIFSIGVIVYEMLTTKFPYKQAVSLHLGMGSGVRWDYLSSLRYRQDIPLWLDHVLRKACHPDEKLRYQSMSELVLDLKTPNKSVIERSHYAPLLERNPLGFWQLLCGLQSVVIILLLLLG